MSEPESAGDPALDALFDATRPFIITTLRSAHVQPTHVVVKVYAGQPVMARVTFQDDAAREHAFDAIAIGPIGDVLAIALGDFTVAGLNALPVAAPRRSPIYSTRARSSSSSMPCSGTPRHNSRCQDIGGGPVHAAHGTCPLSAAAVRAWPARHARPGSFSA